MIELAERISALSQEIRGLEDKYRRQPNSVQILAVSKRHSADKIRELASASVQHFGENYLQEALDKMAVLQDLELQWHFIGPIQSNKTRGIAENFAWVQSLDREKIAIRLNEQRPENLEPLNICVQVNLSGEDTKSGVAQQDCPALCEKIARLPRLRLRGLMSIPAPLTDFQQQRHCFRELAELYTHLAGQFESFDTLSMGMSGDLDEAIKEGSTMIRVGSALFGKRD